MMDTVTHLFSLVFQYFDSIAFLLLSAAGLTIIFGMMGVINMAHGELMMIGAYITAFSYHAGVPAPIAIVMAGLGAGISGIFLERLIVRYFYKKLLSSLVVTWGISLILTQTCLLIFGPSTMNVPTPFGAFAVGEQTFGMYRMVMFGISVLIIGGVWSLLKFTEFGTRARATMENPNMAEALGINTSRIYAYTFGLGSMLGGIAGGMFALTATISPFFGANYTPLAFITVVVGGTANIIAGLVSSAASLAGVQVIFTNTFSVYIGFVAMIAATLIILLVMPTGISEYIERIKSRSR